MASLWLVLIFMMADVMGRGHGGDGAGDEPPPGGDEWWRAGGHRQDATRKKKVRGPAKNLGLRNLINNTKRRVNLSFDEEATYMPVGQLGSYFTREIGIYMQRNIPFDREGWSNVEKHESDGLYQFIRSQFNLDMVEDDLNAQDKKIGGVMGAIAKRYKDRKAQAKRYFRSVGGYDDLERALARPPHDMKKQNWARAIEHFCSEEHRIKSATNSAVRKKQTNPYRGGTSSFATHCYNKNFERYDAYRQGHTDKEGRFDSPQNEENYNKLKAEFESQTQRIEQEEEEDDEEYEAGCSSSKRVDTVGIFETVLGPRRGHTRGIGPRPYPRESFPQPANDGTPPPQLTQEQFMAMMSNPEIQAQMFNMFNQFQSQNLSNYGSQGSGKSGGDDDDDDEDDDDEDDDM